jgi:Na+-transporting methylmalonyl-CoA/oxaloacetate decarboxylase gamma subunit
MREQITTILLGLTIMVLGNGIVLSYIGFTIYRIEQKLNSLMPTGRAYRGR